MKLATYKAIRPGIQALGSIAVQLGTRSPYSHTELIFEPSDGVDQWMPDKTLAQGEDNTLWSFGAAASDIMPEWSARRAGHRGGCRFKRIEFTDAKWDFVSIDPALVSPADCVALCKSVEGLAYDWRHIFSFLGPIANLVFRQSGEKYTCAEVVAMIFGLSKPELFHPYLLKVVSERFLTGTFPEGEVRRLLKIATGHAMANIEVAA